MERIELSDGKTRIVIDSKNEPCYLCGTSFKQSYFEWGLAHGSAISSCCNAQYQIKDYYVDPEKTPKDVIDFVNDIGKEGKFVLNIKDEWVEPLKKAIEETGIKDINDEDVFKSAEKNKLT